MLLVKRKERAVFAAALGKKGIQKPTRHSTAVQCSTLCQIYHDIDFNACPKAQKGLEKC
jgi:hypothetical protein